MNNIHNILLKPYLTEKNYFLKGKGNHVSFIVSVNTNKVEIKKAIEKVFSVSVLKVNSVNVRGKKRQRQGQKQGRTPGWKKVFVTLKKGDKIDYFEGA